MACDLRIELAVVLIAETRDLPVLRGLLPAFESDIVNSHIAGLAIVPAFVRPEFHLMLAIEAAALLGTLALV